MRNPRNGRLIKGKQGIDAWKGSALPPRQGEETANFSLPAAPGLKAFSMKSTFAALKGPLFHQKPLFRTHDTALKSVAVAILACFVLPIAHTQVTFERLV